MKMPASRFDKVINCCFCSGRCRRRERTCTRGKNKSFYFNLSQVEEEHINMLSHTQPGTPDGTWIYFKHPAGKEPKEKCF